MKQQNNSAQHALDRAIEHYRAGRLADATRICRHIAGADPRNADAVHLLGVIAHRSGRNEDAVKLLEKAIGLQSAPPPSFLNNLAEAYRTLGQPKRAEEYYRRALSLDPRFAEAHSNLGNALLAMRRLDEAEQCYRKAMELDPKLPVAAVNYSLLHLLNGNYPKGFALYERRFEAGDAQLIGPAQAILGQLRDVPRWGGEKVKSDTLLVWTEQGLGDSLMMARYLPRLRDRIGRLLVYCEPALERLMRALDGVDEVYSGASLPPRMMFQYHCPIMSLPLIFGTRLKTIPSDVPYLSVPDVLRRRWWGKVEALPGPRIGLVWAGGRRTQAESSRSMRLETYAPLINVVQGSFVSLQKGKEAKQIKELDLPLVDWMDECDDFLDTAAIIAHLDLVISVDTSVAHLAGALARPVWLLNRFRGAWQWMLDREDSPWYPSMRIFRQATPGDWDGVLQHVTNALRAESNRLGGSAQRGARGAPPTRQEKSLVGRLVSRFKGR